MNGSSNLPHDTNLYNSLNQKDTQELVKIWQENDSSAWTPEAFAAIRDILLERLGRIPVQATPEPETEEDTYHDPERLEKIASWAHTLSWVMLIFYIVKPLIEIYLLWVYSNASATTLSDFTANVILSGNRSILLEFFLAAVYFVLLQALSEGIYLFMDIEENTRKQSPSSTK